MTPDEPDRHRPPDPPPPPDLPDNERTLPSQPDTIPSDPRTLPASRSADPGANAPHSIGNYTIYSTLGEGGMGVVYEAEQQHPKRKVALKVVRGGHFVDEISIRMFEREAETLGRLKHPGIAAIYESGVTEEGQHFFAMELVRGKTLDAHLAGGVLRTPLSRDELQGRLSLFRKVCEAVNYAHQRGVIHRDLKPSNIVIDEALEPKILDFGLARITDTDVANAGVASVVGEIKGTLAYMSPEQAQGHPDGIDLRADVYSLGVILYEMLTGDRPYGTESDSIMEAIRVITTRVPAPFRGIDAARKLAGGEIETIVMKALEKDPDRRYQSAAAFADDIERHLTDQPILARPPSTIYQMKKLITRNKLPFAFAASLALLLVGFGIWMSVLYQRADMSRRESDAVTDFLSEMLAAVDPGEQGRDVTVREVLDNAATGIADEFPEQPLVRSRLMMTMGDVYRSLGHYEQSRHLSEGSLAIRETELGPDHPEVALVLDDLANNARREGDFEKARALAERSLALREKVFGFDGLPVAVSLSVLGSVLFEDGELEEALAAHEGALAIREREYGPDDVRVAKNRRTIANVLKDVGRPADAKPYLVEWIAHSEREQGPEHPDHAMALRDLGNLHMDLGEFEEARPLFEQALVITEKAYGSEHPNVGGCLHNLGLVYKELGDMERARPVYERGLMITEKTLGSDHPNLGRSLNNYANLLMDLGDYEASRPYIERALAIAEKTFGSSHPIISAMLSNYGNAFYETGDYAGARPIYERAYRVCLESLGPEHPQTAGCHHVLANLERDIGNYAGAKDHYETAQAIWDDKFGPGHPHALLNLTEHAELLRLTGRENTAIEMEAQVRALQAEAAD